MNAPILDLMNRETKVRLGLGWLGGFFLLIVTMLILSIETQGYWTSNRDWLRAAVFGAFTLINSLRILAYIPQMLTAAKDNHGASGISYATWLLFLLSHLTTITYAMICLGDSVMAFIFLGNAVACLAVLLITFFKRRQYAAQRMNTL